MVNLGKLANRAKQAKTLVDQQGGPAGLRRKAERLRDVAMSEGTVGQRARAAASVAREKPVPKRASDVGGPDRPAE